MSDKKGDRGQSGQDTGAGNNAGTGVVAKPRPKTKKPSLYKVLLLNDDYTPMEFVVHILERFFNKGRDEAVQIMESRRIKRLPVVRGGEVVGIVSRANLLHALASLATAAPPPAKTDAAIRDAIARKPKGHDFIIDRRHRVPAVSRHMSVTGG